MLQNPDHIIRLAAEASAFGLVLAFWIGAILLWSIRTSRRDRSIQERLGLIVAAEGPTRVLRLWREGAVASTTVPGAAEQMSWMTRFRRLHYQAGLSTDMGPVLTGLLGAMAIVGIGIWVVTHNPIVTIAAPVFIGMGYFAWLGRRIRNRTNLFEKQFVHALELAARSLRAGHPLLGAFTLISEELDAPVRNAFMEVCQQHAMGISLEHALQSVAEASTSADMRLFATSVAIQLRSGGNLADMMERLSFVIRDRLRLGRRIRVLTSQTQFSKRILIGMPFVLFAVLSAINPEYVSLLYTRTEGAVLLGAGSFMMALGIIAMNRMAILKY
jgi:tight adherence protein B